MTSIRLMDILSMKFLDYRKLSKSNSVGIKVTIFSIFSIGIMQEKSIRNAIAVHVGFLPLRLFIGFNIANRWIL